MKKLHGCFAIILVTILPMIAQISITEVMYNPPESGQDSLEFIEIFNSSDNDIDLTGYEMTQGIVYTFPNVTIDADSYMVIAKDSIAMNIVFGITAFQWNSGSLSNAGEDVELSDQNGNVIDYMDYSTGSWDIGANGLGGSLSLCDLNGDHNDPGNWQAITTNTGIFINNIEISATPGEENICQGNPSFYPPYTIGQVTTLMQMV